ncbi:MAG: UDP-N-acetylglucosamine 2-epimerase, partial [Oscillospiraceae bacterium]
MKGTERTISIVTGTRAEFGLLSPVIESILADKSLQLQLIVTGAHLCAEYGSTVSEIESAGFPISLSLDILEDSKNTPVYRATAAALDGLAEFWSDNRPDIVVLLGDRYEAFAAAAAAAICGIPIAHIGGGDVTEGAKDEFFRHCITKMSTLHFPICARSRLRIIQLGENPKSVFCAGSLGSQNIERYGSIPAIELSERCGLDAERPFLLCTYHPETQGDGNPAQCVR